MLRSEVDKDGAFGVWFAAKCDKMQIYLDWIKVMSDYLLDLFSFVSYLLFCSLPPEEGLHFLTISHVSPCSRLDECDKGNVERLKAQLLRKDSQLTESRLEALSSRGEMTRLKV